MILMVKVFGFLDGIGGYGNYYRFVIRDVRVVFVMGYVILVWVLSDIEIIEDDVGYL